MAKRRRNPEKAAAPRGARQRKDGIVVMLNAYVSPDLAQKTKARALDEGATVSALVAAALERHLSAG